MSAVRRAQGRSRIAFRHGARLTARDFQAAAEHERRLHGLHVRALHDTWGIALGYETAPDASGRDVRVGPGLAYDCDGQELLLADAIAIPGPTAAGPRLLVYDLVLRAADPLDRTGTLARDSVCVGGDGPRPVVIRWVLAGAVSVGDRLPLLAPGVRLGRDVPLGRFVRATSGSLEGPDPSVCRRVRPLLRPHVASGRVTSQLAECTRLTCRLVVDTREGGFSGTPMYFASFTDGLPIVAPGDAQVVGPFVSVAEASSETLTLQLTFALRPSGATDTTALETKIKVGMARGRVDWMGLEPFGGCPPNPAGRWFLGLGGRLIDDLAAWPGLFELVAAGGGNP